MKCTQLVHCSITHIHLKDLEWKSNNLKRDKPGLFQSQNLILSGPRGHPMWVIRVRPLQTHNKQWYLALYTILVFVSVTVKHIFICKADLTWWYYLQLFSMLQSDRPTPGVHHGRTVQFLCLWTCDDLPVTLLSQAADSSRVGYDPKWTAASWHCADEWESCIMHRRKHTSTHICSHTHTHACTCAHAHTEAICPDGDFEMSVCFFDGQSYPLMLKRWLLGSCI